MCVCVCARARACVRASPLTKANFGNARPTKRRLVRRRRPLRRYNRRFRRRYRRRYTLYRAVRTSYRKPVLCKFVYITEKAITADALSINMYFNLIFFNNDNDIPRSQVHGYLDIFDQFRIIKYERIIHFKQTLWK